MKELEYIRKIIAAKKAKAAGSHVEYLKELAELSGISLRAIYKLLKPEHSPDMKTVISLHDALKSMQARKK